MDQINSSHIGSVAMLLQVSGVMGESEVREYLRKMRNDGEWGDGIMLSVAAKLYSRPIVLSLEAGEKSAVQHIGLSSSSPADGSPIYLRFFCCHYVSISVNDDPDERQEENDSDNDETYDVQFK